MKKIDGRLGAKDSSLVLLPFWAGISVREAAARRIVTDPHSPAQYRVNGPLSNIEQFIKYLGEKKAFCSKRPDSIRAKSGNPHFMIYQKSPVEKQGFFFFLHK